VTELPPGENSSDDVDERYRSASSRELGRPGESVRRAVLQHAADLAAERASATPPVDIDFKQRAANQAWRRPAAYGGLAAAVLAGLLIAPRFLTPSSPTQEIAKAGPPASALPPAPVAPSAGALSAGAPSAGAPPAAGAPPGALAPAAAPAPATESEMPGGPFAGRAAEGEASRQDRVAGLTADNSRSSPARSGATNDAPRAKQFGASDSASAQSAPAPAAEPSRSRPLDSVIGGAITPPASPDASFGVGIARPIDSASALRQAAALGDLPRLRALLAEQPEIDSRDSSGRSALMLAVLYGHADAVDLLLASGADANAADANGTTPLQAALVRNRSDMIEALRRAGAR
jgi:hypothetical protein